MRKTKRNFKNTFNLRGKLSGLLAVLAPVPLLIAFRRDGLRLGLIASGIGVVCTPIIQGLSRVGVPQETMSETLLSALGFGALAYIVLTVAPAAVLAWSLKRARSGLGGLTLGALLYGPLLGLSFGLFALGTEGSAGALVASWADQSLGLVTEAWRLRLAEDTSFLEAVADLESRRDWYLRWIVRLAPALVLTRHVPETLALACSL